MMEKGEGSAAEQLGAKMFAASYFAASPSC